MKPEIYLTIKKQVIEAGYEHDVTWSETVKAPVNAEDFWAEYAWVVVNSGMKFRVAQGIYRKIIDAIKNDIPVFDVFRHPGKAAAIQLLWDKRTEYFAQFQKADDIVEFCFSLPWIGKITRYHCAKNFGYDCAKPDRHLERIAARYKTTPEALCSKLAAETGNRIATVDVVLWRAAELGWIDIIINGDLWQESLPT